eukprot:CAMPEP_0174733168 /NCGR_PEP_ID=MMETSP1094-20130205/60797_1 /TAXON_ID=156173 /ORGANISM="Chrysochromulina brevifilum, Strain UTEX LB 985" /LENGTH=185 /DNA_ID=CAMNT_0015935791 /DNA_START=427 /DNA_END=981 /DNA_ORIENTATION=-
MVTHGAMLTLPKLAWCQASSRGASSKHLTHTLTPQRRCLVECMGATVDTAVTLRPPNDRVKGVRVYEGVGLICTRVEEADAAGGCKAEEVEGATVLCWGGDSLNEGGPELGEPACRHEDEHVIDPCVLGGEGGVHSPRGDQLVGDLAGRRDRHLHLPQQIDSGDEYCSPHLGRSARCEQVRLRVW